jgi:hypothetical protein
MIRAKFSEKLSHFRNKNNKYEPLELYLYLSMGANRCGENSQDGEKLMAFIDLINRSRLVKLGKGFSTQINIAKIKIVLTSDLYQLYVGSDQAKKSEENWLKKNEQYLEKLDPEYKFDANTDILKWADIIKQYPLFSDALQDVCKLYEEDHIFQNLVNEKFIPKHSFKYSISNNENDAIKAAKEYLFQECAIFMVANHVICYPSPKFNDAVSYVLSHFGNDNKYPLSFYLGYEFNTPSPNKEIIINNDKDLSKLDIDTNNCDNVPNAVVFFKTPKTHKNSPKKKYHDEERKDTNEYLKVILEEQTKKFMEECRKLVEEQQKLAMEQKQINTELLKQIGALKSEISNSRSRSSTNLLPKDYNSSSSDDSSSDSDHSNRSSLSDQKYLHDP